MLYYLNKKDKSSMRVLKRTNLERLGWKEKDLEELLVNNMELLLDEQELMPIFTERRRQEEPDIIAIDKKGKLYIFELKRWRSQSENLLQVFRYGQIFGQYSYGQLNQLFLKFSKSDASLLDAHQNYFSLLGEDRLKEEQFNQEQHFLIVTDGTDMKTREAINYWRKVGISIESIVYRIFVTEKGEHFIELNSYSPYRDVIESEKSSYIVNTNYTNSIVAHEDMLRVGKAAAYYDPWKFKINRIQKGERVFLYQSGKGIVAIGRGSGVVNIEDYEGRVDEEYNTPLQDFQVLKKRLSAAEIREVTGDNFVFNQTLFSIKPVKSEKLCKYIKENCV